MGSFHVRLSSDLATGLLFASLGIAVIYGASHYAMGSAARMGPGFMPLCIGTALTLLGLVLIGRHAIGHRGEAIGTIDMRPVLLVLAGVIGFGLLVDGFGFVLAVVTLVVLGRAAGRETKIREVALLAAGLATVGAVIFIWGLGMPLSLWPR